MLVKLGLHMTAGQTVGNTAIVTTATATQHLEVIHREDRLPQVRAVAVLADFGGSHMLHALAGGNRAVVTARTVGIDQLMVKTSWYPGFGNMAIITGILTGNMSQVFARRRTAVMTTQAVVF